jgi:predicted phosphodiesterase
MDRSVFIKTMGLTAGALMFAPAAYSKKKPRNKVKFGVITDLHHDIMHDAPERLQAFITQMQQEKADFILQLGDFCRPYDYNNPLMDIWNSFPGARYHVIGNHDTDGGFEREQVVEFWQAKGKYYSYDQNGFHFVVLDGNEHNPSPDRPGGYARFISNTQIEWLRKDLKNTVLPTIVSCHQGLDNDSGGLENGTLVRYTLEQANANAGFQKVILVLSGHHHQDYYNHINNIHYVQINSASYQWLGDDHKRVRYSEAVDKSHPWIKYTVPYRDPLWALIEIDSRGTIGITGRKTEFVGPSPQDLKVDMAPYIYPIVPQISDRSLKFLQTV